MNQIHFQNHQEIIFEELDRAQSQVLISVAWLNFNIYQVLFTKLVARGVEIKIIVNDDYINNRHAETLNFLKGLGMKIKKVKMFSPRNYMHHKLCIVDNKKLLIGSFNWSINARNNYENLLVLEDKNIIYGACNEFSYLWKLNKLQVKAQKKLTCFKCKSCRYNLIILNNEENYTNYKIVSVCECDDYNEGISDHWDISFYNSIMGIFDNYNDQIKYVEDSPEQLDILEQEYECNLTELFFNLTGDIIIHGVALLKYDIYSQDGSGEWITKVIWKCRFAYNMQMEYYHTFNMK